MPRHKKISSEQFLERYEVLEGWEHSRMSSGRRLSYVSKRRRPQVQDARVKEGRSTRGMDDEHSKVGNTKRRVNLRGRRVRRGEQGTNKWEKAHGMKTV